MRKRVKEIDRSSDYLSGCQGMNESSVLLMCMYSDRKSRRNTCHGSKREKKVNGGGGKDRERNRCEGDR